VSKLRVSEDGETYLFDNELYRFFITPKHMRVHFKKSSAVRTIVHFTKLGFEIDLSCMRKTNIDKGFMRIIPPKEWTQEETIVRINTTLSELTNLSKQQRIKTQAELEKNNIDNATGDLLDLTAIHKRMRYLKSNGGMDKLLIFLNYFNLELGRPKYPVIYKGSNGIQNVYETGFKWTKRLFEEGRLRRLTEDEYIAKINADA
jgi:hypothetical protein